MRTKGNAKEDTINETGRKIKRTRQDGSDDVVNGETVTSRLDRDNQLTT